MHSLELIQFNFSHFNEKARWALDFKGLAHRRHALLPGPHMPYVKRRTGQTSTPVLCIDGETYVSGSAAIIDWLESTYLQMPTLYPHDPGLRAAALECQAHFDAKVGLPVRICVFAAMLDDSRYVADLFSRDKPALQQWAYRLTFPIAKGMIKKGNGITGPDAIENAKATVTQEMDMLVERLDGSAYLFGETFSVADLTAAALLAPLVDPEHPDMKKPEPRPAGLIAASQVFGAHPAATWVREMYARHR
jgi:glutathione S-transferase